MQDPIADMLTRIRNAYMARLASTVVPYSKIKLELAKLLSKRGFVGRVTYADGSREFKIALNYNGDKPALEHVKRISSPGVRVYIKSQNLRRVRSGLGVTLISTSKGIMTGDEAKAKKLGGEVIAEAW